VRESLSNHRPTTASEPAVVEIRDAVKRFGDLAAVDHVSISIPPGICYALLGPNGAGKSTLSRLIAAVSPSDAGDLRVFGREPWRDQTEVKARLGVVPQEDALDEDLDVRLNLEVYGRFFGMGGPDLRERAQRLLEEVGLADRGGLRIHQLSGGMRRRLLIARSLLNSPELLILDEPTTGLDPQVRHAIWASIRRLKAGGMTILLTTHYMEEAQQLADRVGILHRGRLIAEDTPRRLIAASVPAYVLEFDAESERGALERVPPDAHVDRHGDRAFVFHDDESLLRAFVAEFGFETALVRPSTLEDVFLELTGRTLDE
jgi:lipooligosaccharide transport system ATP-binding protein